MIWVLSHGEDVEHLAWTTTSGTLCGWPIGEYSRMGYQRKGPRLCSECARKMRIYAMVHDWDMRWWYTE